MAEKLVVVESHGKCTGCGKRAILGNGLCVECWDGKGQLEELARRGREAAEQRVLETLAFEAKRAKEQAKEERLVKQLARRQARLEALDLLEVKRAEAQIERRVLEAKKAKKQAERAARRIEADARRVQEAKRIWGKVGAHVDRSVSTPNGVVMIDKRGVSYRVPSGRKQTGEWRNCLDCGRSIYVRSHRKGPTQGKRCAPCNRKVYLPPRKQARPTLEVIRIDFGVKL